MVISDLRHQGYAMAHLPLKSNRRHPRPRNNVRFPCSSNVLGVDGRLRICDRQLRNSHPDRSRCPSKIKTTAGLDSGTPAGSRRVIRRSSTNPNISSLQPSSLQQHDIDVTHSSLADGDLGAVRVSSPDTQEYEASAGTYHTTQVDLVASIRIISPSSALESFVTVSHESLSNSRANGRSFWSQ